ncbi:MAG TPA: PP2C family protein-serine/threonine phosphatase [Pirellulales bacterium]|nr:PP2C family protein-serine/threonine phosphatase [Pirellulales bacterium]
MFQDRSALTPALSQRDWEKRRRRSEWLNGVQQRKGLITAEPRVLIPALITVANLIPTYLKLHSESASEARHSEFENFAGLTDLCDAFSAATGWPLRYESGAELRRDQVLKWSAPVNPGVGDTLGHLRIDLGDFEGDARSAIAAQESAERLAGGIADLLGQLLAARRTVWNREAELAAGVPVVARPDEPKLLAARLKSILQTGAEACDAQAAALYMLDESTTLLKLRAAWGLPVERLMQPARPLEGAVADLEALLGHAVALERAASFGPWRVPEEFPAALCVPVSSPTVPLGTLWLFSDRERDFTDRQTGLAEMTAGRLAAELERAMLITAQVESTETARQLDAARRLQQSQLPQSIRLVEEGWELAGRIDSTAELSGAFYDWHWLPGDALAVMIGEAGQTGIAGALTAANLRSTVRTLTESGLAPAELLTRVNRSLWLTAGGDESASLVFGIVDLAAGRLRYSWAGKPSAIRLFSTASEIRIAARPPLGTTIDGDFSEQTLDLAAGETLVVCSRDTATTIDARENGDGSRSLTEKLSAIRGEMSAAELVGSWTEFGGDRAKSTAHRAIVAIKRMRKP